MKGSWGILGGAFDPIHLGHHTLTTEILEARHLDGVILVPSFRPPHKADRCVAAFDDRVEMVKLMTLDDSRLKVSLIEQQIDGPGFTLDVMRALKAEFPLVTFCFIVGTDIITEFQTWHKPDEILKEMPILVGSRPGYDVEEGSAGMLPEGMEMISTTAIELSSTKIRSQIKRGIEFESLCSLVGDRVARYITDKGLYR
ncbi:MAG: nicotinate (nicotinamide) nucleotide adenylyltransferase [Candidatus Zixiibacteriota bacterium]|nr:MAG: nicotinate (nicotinamide) nucleotide adenylyltransferase [candidate division Zixibacteria bacterium]